MRFLWIVVAALGLGCSALAQLNPVERQGVADALYLSNLQSDDLVRSRAEHGPTWCRNLVNDPLAAIEQLSQLQSIASQRSLAQLLGHARTKTYGDGDSFGAVSVPTFEAPPEVPEALRPSVKRLGEAILYSNELVRQGLQKLSLAERRTLIEALPRQAVGSAPVKFEFIRQPMPSDPEIAALLARVDLSFIRFAGQHLAQEIQEELPRLREAAKTVGLMAVLKVNVSGVITELSGTGDDVHSGTDAVLCIDLGGNDRYTGRYGAGVGYSGALVDLGGDDIYECPDLSIGAGVLGVGIAFELGGDDRFRGKSICFGSGIAGVGAMLKDGGEDDYRSVSLAQGFGFHGIGLLLDTKGDDHYRIGLLGQGAGKSGGMGWMVDKAGGDTYRSGGLAQSHYLDGFFVSMTQGVADGPGAIGLVTNLGGDDDYLADVQSQGFGRKEGIGALMDSEGRDTYAAGHESQASGNSRGAGFLLDAKGDDIYSLRLGNGHGFASNYGLGVLYEQSGSDIYAGQDSRPGSSVSNGTALFIDSDGDDRYQGPPGLGSLARGGGSMAVFVDLAGSDHYADGLANSHARSESAWGAALDVPGQGKRVEVPDPPKPGSKPMSDEATMEALFRRGKSDDRTAIDELIAIGEPALRWVLSKKLYGADEEAIGVTGWLAMQIDGAEDLCVAAIDLSKESQASAAIQVCQLASFRKAGPRITEALDKPGLQRVAIRAAGALGISEATPKLIGMADKNSPAMVALSQIGDERAFALMQANLEAAEPELRLAGVLFLAKFPERALAVGKQLVGSQTERTSRTAIELLSLIGSPESLAEVGKALRDPRRGVQIQALTALEGRCPREFWPQVSELRKSSDLLVKAVAIRMDLGR